MEIIHTNLSLWSEKLQQKMDGRNTFQIFLLGLVKGFKTLPLNQQTFLQKFLF